MEIISHTRWEHKYNLVWITKYRKPVLTGEVAVWLRVFMGTVYF
jgi:REP element-mobilizing transposase RayT